MLLLHIGRTEQFRSSRLGVRDGSRQGGIARRIRCKVAHNASESIHKQQ
jgi:hypothetical protein